MFRVMFAIVAVFIGAAAGLPPRSKLKASEWKASQISVIEYNPSTRKLTVTSQGLSGINWEARLVQQNPQKLGEVVYVFQIRHVESSIDASTVRFVSAEVVISDEAQRVGFKVRGW